MTPQTVGFNRDLTAATVPGPRAYPATPTGVYSVGWVDQGGGPAVWGGLPAENAGAAGNGDIGWKYINSLVGGNPGYKWCAFQGPPSVHTGLPNTDPYANSRIAYAPSSCTLPHTPPLKAPPPNNLPMLENNH